MEPSGSSPGGFYRTSFGGWLLYMKRNSVGEHLRKGYSAFLYLSEEGLYTSRRPGAFWTRLEHGMVRLLRKIAPAPRKKVLNTLRTLLRIFDLTLRSWNMSDRAGALGRLCRSTVQSPPLRIGCDECHLITVLGRFDTRHVAEALRQPPSSS